MAEGMKKQPPRRHFVHVPGVAPAGIGTGSAGERHHKALHSPLTTLEWIGLSRYKQQAGDVITRLVVARYRGVLEGAPLWHAVVLFEAPDTSMRLVPGWTRRDRRRALQVADGLLAKHGEGEMIDGATIEGLNVEIGLHRLRRVTRAEMACFPSGYLEKPSLLLMEDEDAGEDRIDSDGETSGSRVSLLAIAGDGGGGLGALDGSAGSPAP